MNEPWRPSALVRTLLTVWAVANVGTLMGGAMMLALRAASPGSHPAWIAGLALSCANAAFQCVAVVGLLRERRWGRLVMPAAALVNVVVAVGALGSLAWMILATPVGTTEATISAFLAVVLVGWLVVWASLARRLRR